MIIISDLVDPNDPNGRTYREVNHDREHRMKVGQLVELKNGCRLYISRLTRDCDGEPLYSLTPMPESEDPISEMKQVHGFSEDCLSSCNVPTKPENEAEKINTYASTASGMVNTNEVILGRRDPNNYVRQTDHQAALSAAEQAARQRAIDRCATILSANQGLTPKYQEKEND